QKPYTNGTDEYYEDLHDRFARGEAWDADSIRFADSLKYTTEGGKTVYGGGGIMPDLFIPIDTTGGSVYFNRVANRGLIYRFALKFSDDSRPTLSELSKWEEFDEFLEKEDIFAQFTRYASSQGVKPDPQGIRRSGDVINTQLKAYIARNFIDNDGFYPIWLNLDTTLKKAISFLMEEE
ncbi:MAG: hypothetical protein R3356_07390, partial [Eudoraea sp.]|nr:hypothetical protein [Eudoraea sp.]